MNLYVIRIIISLLLLADYTESQNACIGCCMKGAPGSPGLTGPVGPPGMAGLPATHGKPGFIGPHGLKGDRGLDGDIGAVGEKGEKGPRGLSGPEGLWHGDKGDIGEEGDQGSEGPKGNIGPTSSKGKKGTNGIPGDTGKQRVSNPSSFHAVFADETYKPSSNSILTFNGLLTNVGNDFVNNKKYVAPTKGTYFFSVRIGKLVPNNSKQVSLQLLSADGKTDETIATTAINNNDQYDSMSIEIILHLEQGEQVYVQVAKNTVIEGIENRASTIQHSFCGYLIMDD